MNATTHNTPKVEMSRVDIAYLEKMGAEALEQDAYEVYQANPCAETWMEHQRAVKTREIAHARYLDVLIAEQARLARIG